MVKKLSETAPRVVVVTGYVEIPGHPRNRETYDRLGAQLAELQGASVRLFRCELTECWLDEQLRGRLVEHAIADNPKKNTLAYHVVQHQKTAWLLRALETDPWAEVLVWIDYGIFHQPGIAVEMIEAFLSRAQEETAIAIPGCWERASSIDMVNPCWRFCGSTLVCHRRHLEAFDAAIRKDVLARLNATNYVSWEVNAWARVELGDTLPIRWYRANHDQTQFTGYAA